MAPDSTDALFIGRSSDGSERGKVRIFQRAGFFVAVGKAFEHANGHHGTPVLED